MKTIWLIGVNRWHRMHVLTDFLDQKNSEKEIPRCDGPALGVLVEKGESIDELQLVGMEKVPIVEYNGRFDDEEIARVSKLILNVSRPWSHIYGASISE